MTDQISHGSSQQLASGVIPVRTIGGQLSRSTQWELKDAARPLCRITRVNWRWKFWTYRATIELNDRQLDVNGTVTTRHVVINVVDPAGQLVAQIVDRHTLQYGATHYRLDGAASPDTLLNEAGTPLLKLRWRLQALSNIDVLQPLPTELVAIATTACLLHERPTD